MENEKEEPKKSVLDDAKETKVINPLLAEAKSLAERIEEGNKRSEALLKKQEELLAEQALSGTAGGRVEMIPHVETAKEYSDKVMNGKIKND